jgi:endo-1,4-beta-mannosidase
MVIELRSNGFYRNSKFFYPIGFNYWPRDMAVKLWSKYNPTAIENEFRIMHEMGINCIRMFILWEDLSPELNKVNEEFLSKFDHFHQMATKYEVTLTPTLFIGHMSGQDWMSPWFYVTDQQVKEGVPYQEIALPPQKQKKGKIRDIYRDEEVFRQANLQLEALLPKYKDSTTIIAWDLSNENQYMMRPKTPEDGANYIQKLYNRMKELDPNHPITLGMGKMSEVTGFHSFGPHGINNYLDFYSVHTYWVFYYAHILRTLDFYISYKPGFDIRFAQLSGIPVQFQEFGLSNRTLAAYRKPTQIKLMSGYYENAIWSAWVNGAKAGILSWDFTDFADELITTEPYNHKPAEMTFGNLDNQYHIKPSGLQIQRFAQFSQRFDLSQYEIASSQIGIVLPENYLKYSNRGSTLKELSDDNPVKSQKKLENTLDCIENQNKSLFTSYLWCRMAHLMPEFVSFDTIPEKGLSQYKLLIIPNLHQISAKNLSLINQYLQNGGIVYISSNTWIPQGLSIKGSDSFKNAQVCVKKTNERSWILSENKDTLNYIRSKFEKIPELQFYHEIQSIAGVSKDNALYIDKKTREPVLTVNTSDSGKGYFVFNTSSPEINQTSVRKMYKKDMGSSLYTNLSILAKIPCELICNNPFIEVTMFYKKESSDRMLVVINHDGDPQTFIIVFGVEIKAAQDWESKPIKFSNNTISGNLKGYEARCFIIQ